MKEYFINPDSRRLRAGWRILAFLLIVIAITAVVMITVRTVLGGLRRGSDLQFVLLGISVTAAVFISRRFLDKKTVTSLGLEWDKFAVFDLLSGIVNSALVMAGVYFVMLRANLIQFHGFTWWQDNPVSGANLQVLAFPVVIAILFKLAVVAWWEELAFRGYLLQNLMDGIGLRWSIVLSSVVFGLGHLLNPNATLLSVLLIALITPQLIYAYLKSGRLWLPIGIHLGWNFFQASVFGFAASGQLSPSLISQSPTGPDWLSGGQFGAEGSLLILPFTLLSCLAIHYWVSATRHPGQKPFQTALQAEL